MVDADLEKVYSLVNDAIRAEDVFGSLLDPEKKMGIREILERKFKGLSETADPERYNMSPDDIEIARDITYKLLRFYEQAKRRLDQDIYGSHDRPRQPMKPGRPIFKTKKRDYYLGDPIAEGSISTVHEGECITGDEFANRVAIKIANDPGDNELLLREMRTLRILHASERNQRRHLATLLDHFMTSDGRMGLIFRHLLEDGYDLCAIRESPLHRQGVDRKHMVWMLNRILSAIGYAHSLGIVHGNIEPAHLIVRPRDHNVFIVDWCWSIIKPWETGDRFKIHTDDFSAPEVTDTDMGPTPASDLYSIGKCMIDILGGNVQNNEMPDSVEEPLQRFLRSFVIESQSQRAQDAWQTHSELIALVEKLWGKRKFIPFPM